MTRLKNKNKIFGPPKCPVYFRLGPASQSFDEKVASSMYRCYHAVNVRPVFTTKILFTNPSARAGYDTRSVFKRSLTGLNSEFSFSKTSCLTKAEEASLSYYLPIAGGRIIGFIPFPRVLVLCEMQSVSSRI